MDLRQLQTLKPTERLICVALRESSIPMTLSHLSEATGSSPATLSDCVQRLVKRGLIIRTRIGCTSHYSLPPISKGGSMAEIADELIDIYAENVRCAQQNAKVSQ